MGVHPGQRVVVCTHWPSPLALEPIVLHIPFVVIKTAMQGILEVETQLELQAASAREPA